MDERHRVQNQAISFLKNNGAVANMSQGIDSFEQDLARSSEFRSLEKRIENFAANVNESSILKRRRYETMRGCRDKTVMGIAKSFDRYSKNLKTDALTARQEEDERFSRQN
jgi:phage tail tape-measure protein